MRQVNKILGALFVAMFLTFNLQAGETKESKKLFISLTSGDFKQSGMGMAIANAMQKAGVKTTVLVGANAVHFARSSGNQEAFGPTGASVREMMVSLVKNGGKVMLCGMSAKYAQIGANEVAGGVEIVGPGDVYGALIAEPTATLTF